MRPEDQWASLGNFNVRPSQKALILRIGLPLDRVT